MRPKIMDPRRLLYWRGPQKLMGRHGSEELQEQGTPKRVRRWNDRQPRPNG